MMGSRAIPVNYSSARTYRSHTDKAGNFSVALLEVLNNQSATARYHVNRGDVMLKWMDICQATSIICAGNVALCALMLI